MHPLLKHCARSGEEKLVSSLHRASCREDREILRSCRCALVKTASFACRITQRECGLARNLCGTHLVAHSIFVDELRQLGPKGLNKYISIKYPALLIEVDRHTLPALREHERAGCETSSTAKQNQ